MNKNFIALLMCFASVASIAQTKAEIIVSYDYCNPTINGKTNITKMSLLASSTESKYFNDISLWVDSLKSTPEGNAQYMEIVKKSCMTVEPDGSISFDLRKGPTKKSYTYVFTNLSDSSITVYDKFGEDQGYYTEQLDEMKWTISGDSIANVLDHECFKAESDYHGRHWTAWFTPEIPLQFGPWKLHGLPGLILRAEADGGFSFAATGLEYTDRIMSPMYLIASYLEVDRKEALESNEYYVNNTESILNAQGKNVTVYALDENGNRVAPAQFDGFKHSIESDYKTK